MKKITLKWLGALLLLFGAITKTQAQDYTITTEHENLTDLSSITSEGIPVVLYNTGRSAYVKLGKWNEQPAYIMDATITPNERSSEAFIFWLQKEGENYKFKDCAGTYIPKIGYGTTTYPSQTAGLYTITQQENKTWIIKNIDDDNNFNGNEPGSTFTGWTGSGDNSKYQIKPVTINTTLTEYTVSFQDKNGNKISEDQTITSKNHKLTFNDIPFYEIENVQCGNENLTKVDNSWTKPTVEETSISCICIDNVPFEVSESYETAKWYHIQMHNNKNESFVQYIDDNSIQGKSKDLYSTNQYWCFVGNVYDGYKLYNKAAGKDKAIKFATSGNATMTDANEDATVWKITIANPSQTITNTGNKFALKTKTTNSGNIYLNMDGSKILTFWYDDDDGSTMVAYSVETELNNVISEYDNLISNSHAGVVGTATEYEKTKQLIENWKQNPNAELLTEIQALCNNKIQFDPNKYYRIENYCRRFGNKNQNDPLNGGFLEDVDHLERANYDKNLAFYANIKDMSRGATIWSIQGNETDGYKLQNLNSKKYIKGEDGKYVSETDKEAEADNLELAEVGLAQFNIKKKNSTQRLHASGDQLSNGGALMYYNQGEINSASAWFLAPAETIELNITEAGYATVNYPFAVQLPKELTAYTGTANVEKSKFMLEEISNGEVPANTPIVIEGPKGKYSLTIDYTNQDEPIIKDLSGSLVSIKINPEDYILAKNSESVVGFYKTTDGGTLAQNKAYIKSTPAIQAVRGFGFSTEGDGTTGIEDTVTETENEEYYDLQGRRVMNPTKGIYVTKNGKKVLFVK